VGGASVCCQGIAGFLVRINLSKARIINSKITEKKNRCAVRHVAMAKAIDAIAIYPFYIDPWRTTLFTLDSIFICHLPLPLRMASMEGKRAQAQDIIPRIRLEI
jgi:hypothetical protein